MKILLIGEIYSSNLGDGVIYNTVKNIILTQYPKTEIFALDLSGRLGYNDEIETNISFQEKIKRCLEYRFHFILKRNPKYQVYFESNNRYLFVRNNICNLCRENKFDAAIYVGGSLFMNYFAAAMYIVNKELSKLHIPVIYHACGTDNVGTVTKPCLNLLKKSIRYKNIKYISLRDHFDYFVNTFHPRCSVCNTYDIALKCGDFFEKKSHLSQKLIGVGVKDNASIPFVNKILDILTELGISWKLFTNGSQQDYRAMKKILSDRQSENSTLYLERPTSPEELIEDVSEFSSIISYRLHSQIIAVSLGIPFISVSWNEKINEFADKINCGKFCVTEHIDELTLRNLIIEFLNQKYDRDLIEYQKCNTSEILINHLKNILGEK